MITQDFISNVENLISEFSKNPGMLQKKLQQLIQDEHVTVSDILGGACEDVFGDPRLTQTILDLMKGKPLDSGYIQSLDFSEKEEDEAFQTIAQKIDTKLHEEGINFHDLLIEPMLITDYPQYKHEMVGRFIVPQIPQEEIVESGKLSNFCDSVTISMIQQLQEDLPTVPAGLDYDELTEYFYEHPQDFYQAIKDIQELQGPTFEDFISLAHQTRDLEDILFKTAVDTPFEELPPVMATQVLDGLGNIDSLKILVDDKDFSDFEAKTLRGRIYANDLALREIERLAQEHQKDVMAKESMSFLNDLSEHGRTPTYRNFSEALVSTGEAEGLERFLLPEHKDIFESMKKRGMVSPIIIDKENIIPYEQATIIIVKERTPEGKFEKLDELRPRLEPGDFVRLYNFAEKSDLNVAKNVSSNIRAQADKVMGKINLMSNSKPARDKMKIPTGDVVGGNNENFKSPNPNDRGTIRGAINGTESK